ncbi:DUF4349 domain-containing protein [Xanthomonas sp. AM6]|uniref:DUF4349 domain-containing protein n=1 Tax=Xanthomonas sp. AM6 TaxID=2982531 RepID=UPI0021D9CC85|nr:DUF4349 domain-containing protein [Xanthomonas sp. AM6]UYB53736.1 DUF4349 domain-containing protein [Xanthomonas sp. AM6]
MPLLLALAVAGCSKHDSAADAGGASLAEAPAAAPTADGRAAMLAYEHEVSVQLPAAQIEARLKQAQDSCLSGRFGACNVLSVEQRGGEHPQAALSVRIVPAGVEPLIAQAGNGGEIGSRSTRAEDLAQAVQDNAALQQRLQAEQRRLQEFQQRRDLSVADMISLSEKMAQLDTQLLAASQDAAQHRRRIETQRLTLQFATPDGERGRSEIGEAFADTGAIFASATAWAIRAVAALTPFLLLGAVLWWLVAWLRRRRRRA